MPVNRSTLKTLDRTGTAAFLRGLEDGVPPVYDQISTPVPMSTKTMEVPIAEPVSALREWEGDRKIQHLATDGFTMTAKLYEKTVGIKRVDLEDDTVGTFNVSAETLGERVREWPDVQVSAKLSTGKVDLCYDKTPFFGASHPATASAPAQSNLTGSGSTPWYLFDSRRAQKAMIWGLRMAPEITKMFDPDDDHAFKLDEYLWGVRARGVAQYGLWQYAHRIENALDQTNFEAASITMGDLVSPSGEKLGARPNLAIVPNSLAPAAKRLWGRSILDSGEENIHDKAINWMVWDRL